MEFYILQKQKKKQKMGKTKTYSSGGRRWNIFRLNPHQERFLKSDEKNRCWQFLKKHMISESKCSLIFMAPSGTTFNIRKYFLRALEIKCFIRHHKAHNVYGALILSTAYLYGHYMSKILAKKNSHTATKDLSMILSSHNYKIRLLVFNSGSGKYRYLRAYLVLFEEVKKSPSDISFKNIFESAIMKSHFQCKQHSTTLSSIVLHIEPMSLQQMPYRNYCDVKWLYLKVRLESFHPHNTELLLIWLSIVLIFTCQLYGNVRWRYNFFRWTITVLYIDIWSHPFALLLTLLGHWSSQDFMHSDE